MKLPIVYTAAALLAATLCFQSCADTTVTPSNTVTYNDHIQSIVFNNCQTCHSGATPAAGVDLTTFSNVQNSAANGTLLQRINNASSPMPPAGLMSADDRQKFADWQSSGFPEQ